VEQPSGSLSPLDDLFLQRAYELAARGVGSTAPNPAVGAVVTQGIRIVGEGYHHRAGDPHAEVHALRQAANDARGATLYVSLEPCGHTGRTPPCADAVVEAGIARVVAGTLDPTRRGGAAELRDRGIEVTVAGDLAARGLIEPFARAATVARPYVALKMAMSLDGAIAQRPGVREQLTAPDAQLYVRDLRTAYDAVMVGAGTVRVDDPQLTVRPPHDRLRPYVRVVVCESGAISPRSRIFAGEPGYAKSIVLAPRAFADGMAELAEVADVIGVGAANATKLELGAALEALRARGIYSVVCEGGPTLATRLIADRLVDRFYWAIAPVFLRGSEAVPVLAGALPGCAVELLFDRVDRAGPDVILSGTFADV
jgi:diaminohydroxyphosphoribosylaminopyrimidine deaminase/5-amino-6-(5-phosphoribosylamino)uracil reductase